MGSLRFWLILFAVQLLIVIALSALGNTTLPIPGIKYFGWACIVGIFLCLPPLVIKGFVAGQNRIGNGDLPMVRTIQQNETGFTVGVWALVGVALLLALPRIRADMRAERLANEQVASVQTVGAQEPGSLPISGNAVPDVASGGMGDGSFAKEAAENSKASGTTDTTLVSTPGAGSKTRTEILDILRFRLKTKGKFKVDHIRTYKQWAFVRATEVVELDKGELQETDLTVSALLEIPANSALGGWRIVELWSLPDEEQHSFANFKRAILARQRAERLPAALFPGDM